MTTVADDCDKYEITDVKEAIALIDNDEVQAMINNDWGYEFILDDDARKKLLELEGDPQLQIHVHPSKIFPMMFITVRWWI